MDFITLANAAQDATSRILRALTIDDGAEDDDFAHMENLGGRADPSPAAADELQYAAAAGIPQQDAAAAAAASVSTMNDRPLLSPIAESALLELSENFLLYVAMVVITAMVARIYFPSWLEPREEATPRRNDDTRRHAYMNRVSMGAYDSDFSDEDDEDDDDDEGGGDDEMGAKNGDVVGLIRERSTASSSSYFTESYDMEHETRESVYKNLAICAVMLNLTFVSWGYLQERMLTRRYPRITGEYFTYSYALVFTNRFWTLIMSGMLWRYFKPRPSSTTIIYHYAFPSISNMLSSWCQYEALRYVSFPAVTLFKALKLIPVMIMGKMLGNQTYPQYEYLVALLIGVGTAMFLSSTDDLTFAEDMYGERTSAKWTGIMLLGFFLFFDSFTSQWQSRMFKRHRDLSMIELMFATSAFSTVLSFITLVHDGMLWPAYEFILRHSEIHLHFFIFSICSTVGQIFIFYTIKNFGAVVFALIMTARVLISIALSVFLYGHQVTSTGFFGLCVVVAAVGYRLKRKVETEQLVKWKGMGEKSEKEIELVQEWHEHIDT